MSERVTKNEFYSQFHSLCKEYAKGFPCENLAFSIQEFQHVLFFNRKGIDDLMVAEIFQILLDEFRSECVARIGEIGRYCPRERFGSSGD